MDGVASWLEPGRRPVILVREQEGPERARGILPAARQRDPIRRRVLAFRRSSGSGSVGWRITRAFCSLLTGGRTRRMRRLPSRWGKRRPVELQDCAGGVSIKAFPRPRTAGRWRSSWICRFCPKRDGSQKLLGNGNSRRRLFRDVSSIPQGSLGCTRWHPLDATAAQTTGWMGSSGRWLGLGGRGIFKF